MLGDEPVDPFDRPLDTAQRSGRPLEAERAQELDACGAPGRYSPVRPHEVPGSTLVVLRERSEEGLGSLVLERQERDAPVAVEGCGGTRREAAEASTSVVQQHRS